ncbi:MAG TPA: hypothetical protein VFG43_04385, partial [Geminicoccaceae bacterium]|nr:hypothetical protein [Geminicoccaceae bacterium]
MARSRRELRGQVDIWPGFVDALSTLLMAITFLLVVYVLTQFLMNQLLEGRTDEMMRLQTQARDLAQRLELEQDAAAELRRNISQLSADLQAALGARDDVESELQQSEAERDQLAQQMTLLSDEQRLLQRTLDEMRLGRTQAEQQVTSLRQELDEARGVITADREQIELQLGQLVQLRRDIAALTEVRAELERQVAEAAAALQTAES